MEKAIVKKTSKEEDIISLYFRVELKIRNIDGNFKKYSTFDDKKPGVYYILSDKKEYHESDLIVGIDNIREYKLNQFND